MINKTKKELNELKRSYGSLLNEHNNLKMLNNMKANEVRYLRRQLNMIMFKCEQVLGKGEQYTKEVYIGRKFQKYNGNNKHSKNKEEEKK